MNYLIKLPSLNELQKIGTPKLARVAQRKKKCNKFWFDNLFWKYLCDSKLQRMKFSLGPFWRAGGAQADKSAKLGQNGLCMPADISKMAQGKISFFAILNHINIPKTNCLVRICCTFFSSELPLPTWVMHSIRILFYKNLVGISFSIMKNTWF